ncbi:MAG: bifunctional folylpolyglutamate synthase/dihydrofolate synthase [Ruminococcaceae bacterium]|nr:bifunctional folylpolyglutamate synthase/dihydrofolate synthase [Oscillospiraceae bacterium]
MNIQETFEYIHKVNWRGSKPGLSRTKELLTMIGNPHNKLKFIHVAGTNGKGSTCAMLANILKVQGYKTGLYTSPYIYVFNERMQINGENIPDEKLCEITTYVRQFADKMEDAPTEFELITVVAMEYFAREQCDIVVLETGLGGELDSTNVINTPEVAVITAIGLDHVKELGSDISDIARAKAGIIKPEGRVAFYGGEVEVLDVIEKACEEKGCLLRFPKRGAADSFDIGLKGVYQRKNAELVLCTVSLLREAGWEIEETSVRQGIATVKWPGRFQKVHKKPDVIVDGGHNPHGVQGTVDSLKFYYSDKKIHFIMGVMADKEVDEMLEIMKPVAADFVTVTPDNPRAMKAVDLADLIGKMGISSVAAGSVDEGVRIAMAKAGEDDVICAIGSLYMFKEVVDSLVNYAKLW